MVALSLSPGYHITLLVELIIAGRDFTFHWGETLWGNWLLAYDTRQGIELLWQAHTSMELLQRNHFDLMEYPSMECLSYLTCTRN